ncbi:MAG: sigma 54-interacting transcriptional regulator [Myxococcales bacterium]|nr:sigma 54-interacting transcriptional regulator [Myxococcales bacterium]
MLLSELFGHERGSFTGAYRTQRGKLELAEGGTLLLDEVSEIPIQHQALLLRVLEGRRFERVGGAEAIPFRARVVAAANQALEDAMSAGTFRSDLYFRLSVVPVQIPPLRERPEDIELLVRYFLSKMRDVPVRRLFTWRLESWRRSRPTPGQGTSVSFEIWSNTSASYVTRRSAGPTCPRTLRREARVQRRRFGGLDRHPPARPTEVLPRAANRTSPTSGHGSSTPWSGPSIERRRLPRSSGSTAPHSGAR